MYLVCWFMTKEGGGGRTPYAAQRICQRKFGYTFDPKEYEDNLPKLIHEFEYGHEQHRASIRSAGELPFYLPIEIRV